MARFRSRFRGRRRRFKRRAYRRTFTNRHRVQGSGQELKFHDPTSSGTGAVYLATGTSTLFISLNNVREGPSAYQRIGRRIKMMALKYDLAPMAFEEWTYGPNQSHLIMRFAIVYDAQPNGAFPAPADLFAQTPADGTNTYNPLAGPNLNYRHRFLILRDRIHRYNVDQAAGHEWGGSTNIGVREPKWPRFKGYLKLRGLEATFASSVAVADTLLATGITTGNLFLYADVQLVDDTTGAVAGRNSKFYGTFRLRFYD